MVDFSKHLKKNQPQQTPQMEKDAVDMVQRIFEGRIVDPNAEAQEENGSFTGRKATGKDVPLEKMFRCQGELPGCGLPKPANGFYKEIKEICSECALKLAQKHGIDLYWVPLAINCYSITRTLAAEAKRLATPEGQEKGYTALVINRGIDKGRDHFVKSMIEGTKRDPTATEWVTELHDRYKGWLFGHYDIPKEKYSNLPKNDLLG
jgi:hypothetical protein